MVKYDTPDDEGYNAALHYLHVILKDVRRVKSNAEVEAAVRAQQDATIGTLRNGTSISLNGIGVFAQALCRSS